MEVRQKQVERKEKYVMFTVYKQVEFLRTHSLVHLL